MSQSSPTKQAKQSSADSEAGKLRQDGYAQVKQITQDTEQNLQELSKRHKEERLVVLGKAAKQIIVLPPFNDKESKESKILRKIQSTSEEGINNIFNLSGRLPEYTKKEISDAVMLFRELGFVTKPPFDQEVAEEFFDTAMWFGATEFGLEVVKFLEAEELARK